MKTLAAALLTVTFAVLLAWVPATEAGALAPMVSIYGGFTSTSCALDADGKAYCWGQNSNGQVGDGTTANRSTPTAVSGALIFKKLAIGSNSVCGLTSGSAIYCWGFGGQGNIGDGNNTDRLVPTLVSGGYTFTDVSAGDVFACGIRSGVGTYCWGYGGDQRLGSGGGNTNTPRLVTNSSSFVSIYSGFKESCGLNSSGAAFCWGASTYLGDNSGTASNTPVAVLGGITFTSMSLGYDDTCGITTSKAAYCWGTGTAGKLGNGTNSAQTVPTAVSGGLTFKSISLNADQSCGITTGDLLYCWGGNGSGEMGNGTTTASAVPTATANGYSWLSAAPSNGSACGVVFSGAIYCWGQGGSGQLGNNATANSIAMVRTWINVLNGSANVGVSVDPTFAFTNWVATDCNSVYNSAGTSGSGNTLNLGRLSNGTTKITQHLHVTTNAANGYTLLMRGTALSGPSGTFPSVAGTFAAPAAFGSASAFGFTIDGSQASRFSGPLWAAVPATNVTIQTAAPGTYACVGFQALVDATTKAGTYSSTITYTAVPNF